MPGRRGNISLEVPAKLNTFCSHFCVKWNLCCYAIFVLKKNDLADCQGCKLNKV